MHYLKNVMRKRTGDSIIAFNSNYPFHHSLEKDEKGNIYIPIRKPESDQKFGFPENYYNEGFAILDENLILTNVISLTDLMYESGNEKEISSTGDRLSMDPFHINDVHPLILENGETIVYLSLRNRSLTMAYNIDRKHVIWQLHGATSQQHDITPLDITGTSVSIFDNNIAKIDTINGFLRGESANKVLKLENLPVRRNPVTNKQYFLHYQSLMLHNIKSTAYSFGDLREDDKPKTISAGFSQFDLDQDVLVINEHNHGRIFAYDFNDGNILWSFFNKHSPSGALFQTYNYFFKSLPASGDGDTVDLQNTACSRQ